MYEVWLKLLPGFTGIGWPSFFPGLIETFAYGIYYGLDFSVLKPTKPITAGVFFHGLSGVVVSAFTAGAVFAVSYNLARLCPGCR